MIEVLSRASSGNLFGSVNTELSTQNFCKIHNFKMENWIKIHLKHLSDERSESDLGDLLVQPAAGGPHHVLVTGAQNTSVNHNL